MSDSEDIGLSCPICMELYCDDRYPIVSPNCGHSICKECGDQRKSNVCISCSGVSFLVVDNLQKPWLSSEWHKNYGLIDIINLQRKTEEKLKNIVEQQNEIDHMECSNCKTVEKKERLKICVSCAEEWNVDWNDTDEVELSTFIVCGFCREEEHDNHKVIKFMPWKLKHLFSSAVSNGQSMVSSMHELCFHEVGRGREQLEKWNEELDVFCSMPQMSYQQSAQIAQSLEVESALVCEASEDTLPTLRKFTKAVEDSIRRLQLLRTDEEAELSVHFMTVHVIGFAHRLFHTYTNTFGRRPFELKNDVDSHSVTLADYERRIHHLKSSMGRIMSLSLSAYENSKPVYVRRLQPIAGVWNVSPTRVDRLYFTVSHPMTLQALDMIGSQEDSNGAISRFSISSSGGEVAGQEFELWKTTILCISKKITLNEPLQLRPNERYLLELRVDTKLKLFYGNGGENQQNVTTEDITISYTDYEGSANGTKTTCGMFPGFYFLMNQ